MSVKGLIVDNFLCKNKTFNLKSNVNQVINSIDCHMKRFFLFPDDEKFLPFQTSIQINFDPIQTGKSEKRRNKFDLIACQVTDCPPSIKLPNLDTVISVSKLWSTVNHDLNFQTFQTSSSDFKRRRKTLNCCQWLLLGHNYWLVTETSHFLVGVPAKRSFQQFK